MVSLEMDLASSLIPMIQDSSHYLSMVFLSQVYQSLEHELQKYVSRQDTLQQCQVWLSAVQPDLKPNLHPPLSRAEAVKQVPGSGEWKLFCDACKCLKKTYSGSVQGLLALVPGHTAVSDKRGKCKIPLSRFWSPTLSTATALPHMNLFWLYYIASITARHVCSVHPKSRSPIGNWFDGGHCFVLQA